MMKRYTEKQGKYLAFIYYYRKLHGQAPSEADMQNTLVSRRLRYIRWC